jgi:hypothetical protein
MTDDDEKREDSVVHLCRRCPECEAWPRLADKFLDPRSGTTVRVYLCACGKRIWGD